MQSNSPHNKRKVSKIEEEQQPQQQEKDGWSQAAMAW